MTKKIIVLAAAFLILSACSKGDPSTQNLAGSVEKAVTSSPRIPKPEQFKASVLDSSKPARNEDEESDALLNRIDSSMTRPTITEEDIRRGYYFGNEDSKKYGTPSTWEWQENGEKSRWSSSNAMQEADNVGVRELCMKSAGQYVVSCIESDDPDCEYVAENTCRCSDGTRFITGQGCIMTDDAGNGVLISAQELRDGWYRGLPNEKKQNTPADWMWEDLGAESRWQTPGPDA